MKEIALQRKTKETEIALVFVQNGNRKSAIETGIGFLDHMLDLFTFHGGFDLAIKCKGDLHVDAHHSIEDIGILLGQALDQALGERKGIRRYAFDYLPMDECLCRTVLDISGRPYSVFHAKFQDSSIGDFPTQMTEHFFYSIAIQAKLTLHQEILYGENDHHKVEALFKSFGRTLSSAMQVISDTTLSTKGVL